jgi:hypothetical protein
MPDTKRYPSPLPVGWFAVAQSCDWQRRRLPLSVSLRSKDGR